MALDGSLRIDRYEHQTQDKSFFDGHWYSDTAPGISFLALPTFEVLRATGAVGMAPALPFLALGLPEAFWRWPVVTGVAALSSVGGMLYQAGTWGPKALLISIPCGAAVVLAAHSLIQPGRRADAINVSHAVG